MSGAREVVRACGAPNAEPPPPREVRASPRRHYNCATSVNVQLPCLQKDLHTGSISRDIVNFPSELCRRRSGTFAEIARLVPPEHRGSPAGRRRAHGARTRAHRRLRGRPRRVPAGLLALAPTLKWGNRVSFSRAPLGGPLNPVSTFASRPSS